MNPRPVVQARTFRVDHDAAMEVPIMEMPMESVDNSFARGRSRFHEYGMERVDKEIAESTSTGKFNKISFIIH